jgi:hypothetical protein
VSKRNNQSAAAAPEVDPSIALEETRAKVQELQRKRQANREAYAAAAAARDIAKMRALKAEHTEISSEIETLAVVLEADEQIVRDLQLIELTQAERESRRQAYANIQEALELRVQYVAKCLEHFRAAAQTWSQVELMTRLAGDIFRAVRPPEMRWDNPHARSRVLYENFMQQLGMVRTFESIVRSDGSALGNMEGILVEYRKAGDAALSTAAQFLPEDDTPPEAA